MNAVRVLFFATLKERAGLTEAHLELPEGARVRQVKKALAERFPGLVEALPSALISVNREFAFEDDLIPPAAEIAIFPPVSGG
jgi:molybdopterin converting factor subunit 1